MLEYELDKMLFNIPMGKHSVVEITDILKHHPEVQFVSMVGLDIGGHDTDEKIPVRVFVNDMEKMLTNGVQTDGSSVALPKIAKLNNAKVDIIPDLNVNWYVDHNFNNIDSSTNLPVGTLRIPSFLIHNDDMEVGVRVILRDAISNFKKRLLEELVKHPYVFDYIEEANSAKDIEELIITSATELEFWVKTPDDKADREQLSTAQELKEQYWKRTIGPVRTALENTLVILDKYGFDVEMGHKEVGGIKAKLGNSGQYDHIMEQLEIDWKFTEAIQAADNENQIKYIVRDIFTMYGLDVTFMAKPIAGVAGSGEHTHIGLAAKLKNGKMISLFAPNDMKKEFLSPIGYGALMGILKNYEVINPFVSSTNDAFNRLKRGYEAPICIVTSVGRGVLEPSRNRTVLAGLIRDINNPLSTRFELRSPNPKSDTYLVLAASYMACLDGIKAALENEKTPKELETSLFKNYGTEDFYLEKDRKYRTEEDVFDFFTDEERNKLFGVAPETVWENICSFDKYPEKLNIFHDGDVMPQIVLDSYKEQIVSQWKTELHNRIIPEAMDFIRECKKCHNEEEKAEYDVENWERINKLRHYIAKDTVDYKCLLTKVKNALDIEEYDLASNLQIEMQNKMSQLADLYITYKKNLL